MPATDSTSTWVIDDCHELLKWLIPLLDKFPRNRRFTLGERLEAGLLAVLEECVDSTYSKHMRTQLSTTSPHLWQRNSRISFIGIDCTSRSAGL